MEPSEGRACGLALFPKSYMCSWEHSLENGSWNLQQLTFSTHVVTSGTTIGSHLALNFSFCGVTAFDWSVAHASNPYSMHGSVQQAGMHLTTLH
jgi:hypothetical protein